MSLKLVIADRREKVRSLWQEVFRELGTVQILDQDAYSLLNSGGVDAVLMRGKFAHERFGGNFTKNVAQILIGENENLFIITTPPKEVTEEGGFKFVSELASEEGPQLVHETQRLFRQVFEAVDDFNKDKEKPPIRSLGVSLEFLGLPRCSSKEIPIAVRSSYENIYKL